MASDAPAIEVELEELHADGTAGIGSASWQRLREKVAEPLAALLAGRAAAEEADAARQAQVAVDVARALATRACGHVACTTVTGASEAEMPLGKRCGGCRLVRYCGPGCQKADWPAHELACRELQRQIAAGE